MSLARKNLNLIFFTFIIALFTGCSIKDFNMKKVLEPKEKPFVYERQKIDEKLLQRTNALVQALLNNNIALINKDFIHKDFGFYDLYKVDGKKKFLEKKAILNIKSEKTQEISHEIKRAKKYAFRTPLLQEDVQFKCSPLNDKYYGWSKEGIFLNDKTKNYLSFLMNEHNTKALKSSSNELKVFYTKDDFHKAKVIEKMAYKLVVTPQLIIYLNHIDNNWYISLIDRITTNCYEKKIKKTTKAKKIKKVKK